MADPVITMGATLFYQSRSADLQRDINFLQQDIERRQQNSRTGQPDPVAQKEQVVLNEKKSQLQLSEGEKQTFEKMAKNGDDDQFKNSFTA